MALKQIVIIFFCSLFVFLSNPANSQPIQDAFTGGFNGPNSTSISLNGVSAIESNGLLRLTNTTPQVIGQAFYSTPLKFINSTNNKSFSFSTSFAFAIIPQSSKHQGHGFAFTISPAKNLPFANHSQFLGLFNSTNVGNFSNHLFAVEFDTFQDLEFGDINDNHVGIDINSLVSNQSVSVGYFTGKDLPKKELDLKTGNVIQSWIDYDSMNNQLDVRISPFENKPMRPVLSMNIDLTPVFEDYMYIGFSASTGSQSQTSSHYILGWSFGINRESKSLYFRLLPDLPKRSKKNKTALIAGVSIASALAVCLSIGLFLYIRKMKNDDDIEGWESEIGPHRFSYKELNKATSRFTNRELLGVGGFGKVYKGTLPNSKTEVAVKRISHESKQGLKEFAAEISTIGRLRHKNLVQLLGWCRKHSDLILVYDFMPNGSLDKYIFEDPLKILTWKQRFKIIKGVASGLLYLHQEWEQTVIHRDIKAGNVLLDVDLNGRLSDFGLAKLCEHGSNPRTTRVVGTLGYLAPELTRTGKPTARSDVFAFGALLLEVVCGRRPVCSKAVAKEEEVYLVDWVWDKWSVGSVLDVVDPRLGGEFDEVEVVVVLKLGLMCSNYVAEARPTIKEVVKFLEGEAALPEVVEDPDYYHGKKGGGDGLSSPISGGSDNNVYSSYPTTALFDKGSSWQNRLDDLR